MAGSLGWEELRDFPNTSVFQRSTYESYELTSGICKAHISLDGQTETLLYSSNQLNQPDRNPQIFQDVASRRNKHSQSLKDAHPLDP